MMVYGRTGRNRYPRASKTYPETSGPGGIAYPRPPIINGKTYDPFHSPKSVQNPDGTQGFIGGR